MLNKPETLKLIKSIGARGRKLDADIQLACIHAVFYSVAFGDVTIGQKLLEHLNAGSRKAAVVKFLEKYGQYELKGKTVVYRKNDKLVTMLEDEAASEEYCDGIKSHWTAEKPEKIVSIHDLLADTKAFVARMEREIKAGTAQNTEIYDAVALALNEYMEANEPANEDEFEDNTDATSTEGVTSMVKSLMAA